MLSSIPTFVILFFGLNSVQDSGTTAMESQPIRRPVGTWLFIAGIATSLILGYLSALPLA